MPTANRKGVSPKDFTGTKKAQLAAENAAKVAERQGNLAMFQQQQAEAMDTPIQLDQFGRELQVAEEVPDGPIPLEKQLVHIKVGCELEHVTIGQGTDFSFKEGQTYQVPRHVADHLERLGYVLLRY